MKVVEKLLVRGQVHIVRDAVVDYLTRRGEIGAIGRRYRVRPRFLALSD